MSAGEDGSVKLPREFQSLAAHEDWILWAEEERIQKRVDEGIEAVTAFYNGMLPHLERILQHLGSVKLGELSDEDRALMCLTVAFVEIADAVEYYSPHSTAAMAMPRLRPSHGVFGMPDETRRVRINA